MGFWHTGYIEFHEEAGFGRDYIVTAPVYECHHCRETFPSVDELRKHRFQAHPYNRPVLFFKGVEIGNTPVRVTAPLLPGDIQIEYCEQALINGTPLPISAIDNAMATIYKDTVTIELKGTHVSAKFTFRFEIANTDDLEGIDRCFFEVARGRRLDMRAIEHFIQATRPYKTAIGYCDGICEYFYGALAKERSPQSSLLYEAYREKFTRSADQLKDFNRPLSRIIGGLIAFHFNHFHEAEKLAGNSRLGIASKRFGQWLEGNNGDIDEQANFDLNSSLENLVTDLDSEHILRWSVASNDELASHRSEILSLINSDISEFDKAKLYILLGQSAIYQGNKKDALTYAKEFRNNSTLGKWAEHIMEVCQTLE